MTAKKRRWFRRSGKRTTEAAVLAARDAYAAAKRTGKMGPLPCSIQPAMADSVARMTAPEFASWSGMFTWKDDR